MLFAQLEFIRISFVWILHSDQFAHLQPYRILVRTTNYQFYWNAAVSAAALLQFTQYAYIQCRLHIRHRNQDQVERFSFKSGYLGSPQLDQYTSFE